MEVVEEPPLPNPSVEGLKISVTLEVTDGNAVEAASVETDVCHKSNGVAESSNTVTAAPLETKPVTSADCKIVSETAERNDTEIETSVIQEKAVETPSASETNKSAVQSADSSSVKENTTNTEELPTVVSEKLSRNQDSDEDQTVESDNVKTEESEDQTVESDNVKTEESVVEVESILESNIVDHIIFETEILVESNDSEIIETVCDSTNVEEQDNAQNMLSQLKESIELSEALCSSDATENVENNNCSARQEVFNKEELLDILEGNDDGMSPLPVKFKKLQGDKILEAKLALQQLSRLKQKSKKPRSIERIPRKKEKKGAKAEDTVEIKNEENIVNNIVKEWDDEETTETEKSHQLSEESDKLLKSSNEIVNLQDSITKQEDDSVRTSIDSIGKTPSASKSGDEGQPQRRLGRVIKKKVIFDPDNPDTFTKSKIVVKTKEQSQEKELAPPKKIKQEQTFQQSQPKSPSSKIGNQWKKPIQSKNSKQNKRLSEVDKLLMDEGAVNMIYQLTPEAPKGRKNMRTKAEFIKKIQSSSTPDTKEMKFRERKKECKYEEGDAKRILGGKHRSSLNSSVKSPSVSEDFEAHSADDSIIYRRHSSSSYSSSCMSPRRLSDVETGSHISTRSAQQIADIQYHSSNEASIEQTITEMFVIENVDIIKTETINKDDCLSIKQKLNSKLNLALNKRKRENSKAEKPPKQKKIMKSTEVSAVSENFKYLSVRFEGKLAIISVLKPGSVSNVEDIKELARVLKLIESKKDISVTLLMPECGSSYSDIDLRLLLEENNELKTTKANEIAESIKSLLLAVEQHTKLLCAGANGRCTGVALAIIGLSEVVLASERTSFAISAKSHGMGPIEPGVSVLTAYRQLPQPMLNDLVVFGRRLSASEALQGGLVSRVLWPDKINDQVLAIAKDIAAQPTQNIWLKKQMLSLKKSGSECTFLKSLEKERDLFVEYWTSVEGQELLRACYNA